jgi:hypothetical protein
MAKKILTPVNEKAHFVFDRINYQLLLVSIFIVVIGFVLMSGTSDIYSFTKTVLAPIVVIGGFIFGFYAILKKVNKTS